MALELDSDRETIRDTSHPCTMAEQIGKMMGSIARIESRQGEMLDRMQKGFLEQHQRDQVQDEQINIALRAAMEKARGADWKAISAVIVAVAGAIATLTQCQPWGW